MRARLSWLQGRWRAVVLPLSLSLALWALPEQAGFAAAYPADAVKAVFLYRFAGYVQWPPAATDSTARFTIAVLGADAVAAQLRQLLPAHRIQGKPAEVHAIHSPRQVDGAQMLYVGPGYDGDLRALITRLQGRPVLVVTDEPGGLLAGSTVNFLIIHQHVRFEVSTRAARRAGLRISSDLLAVAERVETGDRQVPVLCRPLGRPAGESHRHERCLVRVAVR